MHISVLLQESVDALTIKKNGVYVDGTLGGAGHAELITQHLGPDGTLIGFDLDSYAIARAEERLAPSTCKKIFVRDNFRNLKSVLSEKNMDHVDGILLDLGWSSFQIADAKRGLSFQENGPLQMTLNDKPTSDDITAWDIVNTWDESTIADLLYAYGDETASRKIARTIVQARSRKTLETTFDLVDVILSVLPRKAWMRTHPATKTFQALRIAVNDEYGALKQVLDAGFNALASQGRFTIITFHSGEDRIVKNYFRDKAHAGEAILLTKKPITPSDSEIKDNPRSRSAQLRIIQKN
jgi:16S rRNA (cytosine1402-N4)-methyltransferase